MPRLVHDRVTWLIYAQLGAWGYFLYGFGPVVPLLRDEQGTSAAIASLHSTGLAVGALIGGAAFPGLARRYGRGHTLWLALAGVAIGTTALCLVGPLPGTLAASVATAVFGTIVVSAVVAALTEHHASVAAAAISEANAAAAGMGVIAPLVVGLAVGRGLGWRPGLAVVVGLIALLAVATAIFRVRVPRGSSYRLVSPGAPAAGAAGAAAARLPGPYWIAWTLIATVGSVEVCLSLWAADVLRFHVGMSAGGASAAVASIVAGMFAGRLVGGRLALRVPAVTLLLVAFAISTAGFAGFWLATVGWLAVVGLVVVGLGNAMQYPLAVSLAVSAGGGQHDKAAAYTAYSVAIGFGLAPVALGWAADAVGAHPAFLLVPVFLAVAAALTTRLSRVERRRGPTGARRLPSAGAPQVRNPYPQLAEQVAQQG
ncbi:MAG TPA: MFS transporter [Pilimelia sp.]|nr:MFS transporter [Pilimelia sp.]